MAEASYKMITTTHISTSDNVINTDKFNTICGRRTKNAAPPPSPGGLVGGESTGGGEVLRLVIYQNILFGSEREVVNCQNIRTTAVRGAQQGSYKSSAFNSVIYMDKPNCYRVHRRCVACTPRIRGYFTR